MGAYNVRTLTYKNQTQVRFFKKPIEYDKRKFVRTNARKRQRKKERNLILIYLSDNQCTVLKIKYGISVLLMTGNIL